MSPLPPPPIKAWSDLPPVWRRWFQELYARAGGANGRVVVIQEDGTVSGLDEFEQRLLAAIPERPDLAALEARIAELEGHVASLSVPSVSSLEARVADLEVELASLVAPGRSEMLQRIGDLAEEIA